MPGESRRFPRPFEQSYAAALSVAIMALVPFILVTTAFVVYRQGLARALGAGQTGIELILATATAGYAFGAMLGGDVNQRFPQRPMYLACEGLFVVGAAIAATAGGVVQFGIGQVLMGFATGLLLVVALPPAIQRFPADRMPITSAVVNLGFFGAVTAGPLIAAGVAGENAWRAFYWALGGVGAAAFGLALFTLPDQEARNPELKFDWEGVGLALGATALPFWASGELTGHGFSAFRFTVPLACGMAAFALLMLVEYHKDEPLAPVKPMWNTFPVVGLIAAAFGGGTYVSFLELALMGQMQVAGKTPFAAGIAWWPQVLGAFIAAGALGLLVRTRYLPVLTLAGMVLLIGAGALLLTMDMKHPGGQLEVAAGLLGLGAGATVSPGLWMAGFSLPSKMVGRTFALVELVRSDADYLLAPVMVKIAEVSSGGRPLKAEGIREAIWMTLLVTIAFTAGGTALYLLGSRGLPQPDLEAWLEGNESAYRSPRFGEALREEPERRN